MCSVYWDKMREYYFSREREKIKSILGKKLIVSAAPLFYKYKAYTVLCVSFSTKTHEKKTEEEFFPISHTDLLSPVLRV